LPIPTPQTLSGLGSGSPGEPLLSEDKGGTDDPAYREMTRCVAAGAAGGWGVRSFSR
jgi:hypothetical protein